MTFNTLATPLVFIAMSILERRSNLPHADRRRERRLQTLMSGKLVFGGFSPTVIDCIVLNLSDSGACLETNILMNTPEQLSLILNNCTHPSLRCWALGNQMGIKFLDDEV